MLKKFIDSKAGKIILWPLAVVAGWQVNTKPAINWLFSAACKPDSACNLWLALAGSVVSVAVLVYLIKIATWPEAVDKIIRVLLRILAHLLIVGVALVVLYVLFFFNYIPWFGRHEFPLLLRQCLPPVLVAASYAAYWYRKMKINRASVGQF